MNDKWRSHSSTAARRVANVLLGSARVYGKLPQKLFLKAVQQATANWALQWFSRKDDNLVLHF